MSETPVNTNSISIHRLTALWALCECGLGGILHLTSPAFTGLIVGGFSMVILGLLCTITNIDFKTLMKSLAIVLAVKFLLSPHSSPTAYLAVSFQALVAYASYKSIKNVYVAAIFMGIITMLESAAQKIIVLTVIYGTSLWSAIDQWTEGLVKKLTFIPAFGSKELIEIYLGIYILGGLFFGYISAKMIHRIKHDILFADFNILLTDKQKLESISRQKSKWKEWLGVTIVSFVLLYPYFTEGSKGAFVPAVLLVIRVVLILYIWYALLGPWLVKKLIQPLTKSNHVLSKDISATLDILPYLRYLANMVWEDCHGTMYTKVTTFLPRFIMYALAAQIETNTIDEGKALT